VEPVNSTPFGYVEIINKTGRVTQRTPAYSQTLSIGRALDNDIIVDDPYVSPHHAHFTIVEGVPELVDLQSVNGIADAAGNSLPETVNLVKERVVLLGRTPFRFRKIDQPLKPTLVAARNKPLQLLFNPLTLCVIFLLTVGILLFDTYISSSVEFILLKQIPIVLGIMAVVAIWSMLWSFASRLVTHHWFFWRFCGIACLGFLFSSLAEIGTEYLCFGLGLDKILLWSNYVNELLAIMLVLYLNLRLLSAVQGMILIRLTGTIALVLVLLTWGVKYSRHRDFNPAPNYAVTLKAPAWKICDSKSSEDFFNQSATLFDALNEELQKH
jgi:hypothetical protein